MSIFLMLAQGATQSSDKVPPPSGGLMQMMMPLLLIFAVFYFIMIRPKQKEQKRREQMLREVKKYDKVMTIGGIIGTVMEVRDDEVTVKVDDSTNTRMRFSRGSIQRVLKPAGQKE